MLVTMPNVLSLLNGMFSLIKYGLSDCNDGFTTFKGFGGCSDNGLYERSIGHLNYSPAGADYYELAADLSLVLTAGRLEGDSLNTVVSSCLGELDHAGKIRCMQQLIVTTPEFHSTNPVNKSGEYKVFLFQVYKVSSS